MRVLSHANTAHPAVGEFTPFTEPATLARNRGIAAMLLLDHATEALMYESAIL